MKRMGTVMLVAGWTALTFGAAQALAEDETEAEAAQSEEAQAQTAEPETAPAEPGAAAPAEPGATQAQPAAPAEGSAATPGATTTTTTPGAYATTDQSTMIVTQAPPKPSMISRVGLGMMLGGGVTDFIYDAARSRTSVGGQWDVRAVAGARLPIGLELAYVGTAQDVDSPGLGNSSALIRNGAEGVVRFNLVLSMQQLVIPFVFGGLGWSHQNITNTNGFAVPGLKNNDDMMTIPVGGGLALNYKGGYADARFTYRPTVWESSSDSLDSWTAGANIGFVF